MGAITQQASGQTTGPPAGATEQRRLDEALARLKECAPKFARLSLDERVALARSMQAGYVRIAEASVRAACEAKGIALGTPLEGEEWSVGPWMVVRHFRLVQQALRGLKKMGTTPIGKIRHTTDGRVAVEVFPASTIDGLLFNKVTVEVQLQPGLTTEALDRSRAPFYRGRSHEGRVCLVLGGGNVNAIPSMDVITKLFNDGSVCLLKMNPVNAYLGPYLERAYEEPIRQGFLAIVYGGADQGAYLVQHGAVDEVHITGSDESYDRIMWGPPGSDRDARKTSGRPLLAKPITAELGNVSPVIVVPGPYSDKELAYQAEDIASALTFNASYDCNAVKVVITAAGWPLRDRFIAALGDAFARAPARKAYYPGAETRYRRFLEGRPNVRQFGTASEGCLPWAFCPGLDPVREDLAFTRESFSPILFETSVGSADVPEFVDRAVAFANERLWGTLNATLVVHPKIHKDPVLGQAVERAITDLRYGSVGVNAWAGLLFAYATPPWGGYPGASPADIQSGSGWVHNTSMLEGVEKAVLRHPITTKPKPAYALSHRSAHVLMRRMAALEERGNWSRVPAVLGAAMRA